MSEAVFGSVESYFSDLFVQEPAFVTAAAEAARAAKLPMIAVSLAQGKFLSFLVRMSGARRILEVGTLGGYSTLWMAQAMPEDGFLITLEANPVCAGVARANFAHAGFSDRIELRYGDAIDSFKMFVGQKGAPFDFIFIDASKSEYPAYLKWCLRLARAGTIIVADNVVQGGDVLSSESIDPAILGMREFLEMVSNDPKLDASFVQSFGLKGYDGMLIVRVIK